MACPHCSFDFSGHNNPFDPRAADKMLEQHLRGDRCRERLETNALCKNKGYPFIFIEPTEGEMMTHYLELRPLSRGGEEWWAAVNKRRQDFFDAAELILAHPEIKALFSTAEQELSNPRVPKMDGSRDMRYKYTQTEAERAYNERRLLYGGCHVPALSNERTFSIMKTAIAIWERSNTPPMLTLKGKPDYRYRENNPSRQVIGKARSFKVKRSSLPPLPPSP